MPEEETPRRSPMRSNPIVIRIAVEAPRRRRSVACADLAPLLIGTGVARVTFQVNKNALSANRKLPV